MLDRLPPLTALRAFEAAARHMSFSKAAEELAVTPAALSYQIKSLETHLGAKLFQRMNRAVALTEAGRALLPGVGEGFDTLNRAWRAARRRVDTGVLRVTAGPAFTAKWLAPRLFRFAAAHPEIELRFTATLKLLDFDRDEVDVAIRFGLGGEEGLFSELILSDWVTPMMRPVVAADVATPADLLAATLIHDDSLADFAGAPDWTAWLTAAGVAPGALRGPRFSQADHAIDMALEGAGVVLGRGALCAKYLRDGVLVAPFPLSIPTEPAFRLLCPLGQEERPAIGALRRWIAAETARDAELRPSE